MEQNNTPIKEQTLTLTNRKSLTVSGVNKVVSLKPDLIQLDTVFGGLVINGANLELVKLDNNLNRADIAGTIDCMRFVEGKNKEPFFRKIFKWYI